MRVTSTHATRERMRRRALARAVAVVAFVVTLASRRRALVDGLARGALGHRHRARWTRDARACEDVKRAVEGWDGIRDANAACFALEGGGRRSRYGIARAGRRGMNHGYLDGALKFLGDVVEASDGWMDGTRGATAFWVMEDDATTPAGLADELRAMGVIVLAHSVKTTSMRENVILVPNFHFIRTEGFRGKLDALDAKTRAPLARRKPAVFWRGSTTGTIECGASSEASCQSVGSDDRPGSDACARLPRVKAAMAAESVPWLDVKVSRRVQVCARQSVPNARAMGEHAPEATWVEHKGILEIDGNVDAWGNRWRMESGSVVFVVKSNFEHYYTKRLVDGTHYVGVAADLSDLAEKTELVSRTDAASIRKMERVAENARALMRELTYERVVADVADRLRTAASA